MSTAITFSDKIRALEPQSIDVAVVANGRAGTLSLLIDEAGRFSHIKFNAAGWRALHAAFGTPPPASVKPKSATPRSAFSRTLKPSPARHA
jgi:hypothetical protein